MKRSVRCAAFAVALSVAVPGGAQAATKSVDLGLPLASQTQFNEKYGIDVNDFFPHGITVHVGDTVKFVPVSFHSAQFPAKGKKATPLIAPTGTMASGANDAAGTPFWFDGKVPTLTFSASLTKPAWGKKAKYDGSKDVETGLPLGNKLKPLSITFTKAGTFTYYCHVHEGMKGTVTVKAKSAKIPSAAADKKARKAQVARDLAAGKKLAAAAAKPSTSGNIEIGPADKNGVEFLGYSPTTTTVPAGTTLTFKMSKNTVDIHTASTGPGDPSNEKDTTSYLNKLAGSLAGNPPFDPISTYASDPAGTVAALTPTLHGNGFWSTGVLDTASSTPLPDSGQVKVTAPGTYKFYCLIHTFMKFTVTAQ